MIRKSCLVVPFAFVLLAGAGIPPCYCGPSATGVRISEQLAVAIDLYLRLEFDAGLAITDELLQNEGLAANDSIAIYEIKSIITYAKGKQYERQAYDYLDRISKIGHCVVHLPRDIWPAELRDKWYEISQRKNMLVCPDMADPSIRTIAIMEFDNFSIGKYKEELGDLSKALADFFEHDFSLVSDLKVVERDKIEYILRELELVETGKVDASTAARVGKMLGAQLMVFGSISQIDRDKARMVARVVKVETSEIVLSADREGKPDFVRMEKELVKEIADKLGMTVDKETEVSIMESGTGDMDAAKLYSVGLSYLDRYEYAKAYEYFKQAYDKDNTFKEAKRKMDITRPLVV